MRILLACLALIMASGTRPAGAEPRLFGWTPDITTTIHGTLLVPPDVYQSASDNVKFETYITPKVVLKTFSDRTDLVAYVTFSLIKDANVHTYNNKGGISVGVQVRYKLSKAVKLSFGARWAYEGEFSTDSRHSAFQFTHDGSVYKSWEPGWIPDWLPDGSRVVLSGWWNFRYPSSVHPFERTNGLGQGSLKMALELPYRDWKWRVAPFVSVTAKADFKGRSYNNYVEPALGLDLKYSLKSGGQVTFGVKAAQQTRFRTGGTRSGNIAYISWYKAF